MTPVLLETHEFVNQSQIDKLKEMDKLMFDSWRLGYKRSKILELVQAIEPSTTSNCVGVYFKNMFTRELSDSAIYLEK
ncbi:hypothetical protein PQC39_gp085 [Vibrio phage Vp_R1]|uniref:Uncharacterized protein n=1 Tax=Vibrio phage Vp_R1 TaxID=2059867 RepID=A0A2H5BQ38_9CAUD|nr:hypothetical protein PQC39_gp085 [Vibrio phage Vp_R1]AUG88449.1 hypothetical protein VPR_085 [Vibrio phage Vp_R1]